MNWIKENKFVAGLTAVTVVAMAALVWIGMQGQSRYAAAKSAFDEAYGEASSFEQLNPYPSKKNLEAKKAALEQYSKATASLQDAFGVYRPGELPNFSPQEFTDKLKKATDETVAAFGDKTELPEGYFMGYADYRSGALAPGPATGILGYQLEAIRQMMIDLAEARPTKLVNLHRPKLPEELGQTFEPEDGQVARGLPFEITFQGSEQSARKFLSSLTKADGRYIVVRTLSIRNTNTAPPKEGDAKFESMKDGGGGGARAPRAVNSDIFNLFTGGESKTEAATDEPAEPAPAPVDTSKILAQVLGDEQLTVFVRLDVLQFLPAKDLP